MKYNNSFDITDGNVTIKTPKVNSFNDIHKELKQSEDCIINHSIYPNGLDVTITQLCNKIIITSNKPLIKNDDGSYSFED